MTGRHVTWEGEKAHADYPCRIKLILPVNLKNKIKIAIKMLRQDPKASKKRDGFDPQHSRPYITGSIDRDQETTQPIDLCEKYLTTNKGFWT